MILVDPRQGSGDLVEPLRALGTPAEARYLDSGDVSITGFGPEDRPVLIGVEIKRGNEQLSEIVDRRFSDDQARRMLDAYELRYLLVEGFIAGRSDTSLELFNPYSHRWQDPPQRWKQPWTYPQVVSWEHSANRAGFHVAHTRDRRSTAQWLAALWSNWQKSWEEHNAFFGLRLKDVQAEEDDPLAPYIVRIDRKMKVAASLAEKVGLERARAASAHFKSVRAMVNADEAEWRTIDGFGKKLAALIVAEVTKES